MSHNIFTSQKIINWVCLPGKEKALNSAGSNNTLLKSTGMPEFQIRLRHRQNTSWQGELYWLNTGEKKSFRSLLELINLIQEAAEISSEPEAEDYLRTWKTNAEKVSVL